MFEFFAQAKYLQSETLLFFNVFLKPTRTVR